jgi:hypothetical protein
LANLTILAILDKIGVLKERGKKMSNFDLVKERVGDAKAIAWDTCHKIYILMDSEQVDLMRGYGYDPLITSDQMSSDEMFEVVEDWYESSCSLRFIDAVSTNHINPNAGFETLVSQFDEQEVSV